MDSNLGLMFPGQGSQYVGMGKEAADASPVVRDVFAEADEALGFGLSALCFSGDENELRKTENTQPAILTVSVALYRLAAEHGIDACCMAGHSLGEYSALVAAGSLELGAAVCLVRDRGRYMQEAVPVGEGAMAAILGLEDDVVESICTEASAGGVVSAANYNSPGQVVVAGATGAVEDAVAMAKERGARRAMLLNVSAPFHCALMQPAADRLAAALEGVDISAPRVPVICNVDSVPLREADEIRDALRRQVTAPVCWVGNLQAMLSSGARELVEIGPGKVLAGLAKRGAKGVPTTSLQTAEDIETFLAG
jgi:[acyl-carrier-protein] S-malonyltransferase